jgi:peptidoglycan/LPS O-acetylase OafA/YrhL
MLYFSQLDSLRFLAFMLVFWSHTVGQLAENLIETPYFNMYLPISRTGEYGVHIFFVISGFLITYLLISEHNQAGKINIKNFYLRRILRIWPVYYLAMILGIFVLPNLLSSFHFCGSYWMNLTFLNNFNALQNNTCFSPNITVSWSVAIEEQFYLFWPLAFSLLYGKKGFIWFCFLLYIVSSIHILMYPYSYFHLMDGNNYLNTMDNINYLMIGCLGAYLFQRNRAFFDRPFFKTSLAYYGMILISVCTLIGGTNSDYLYPMSILLAPFLFLYFVLYAVINSEPKGSTLFSRLGKYTYGMYFYHFILIVFIKILYEKLGFDYRQNDLHQWSMALISLVLTIVVSFLSYRYFEGPFLRLKSKFTLVKTRN